MAVDDLAGYLTDDKMLEGKEIFLAYEMPEVSADALFMLRRLMKCQRTALYLYKPAER